LLFNPPAPCAPLLEGIQNNAINGSRLHVINLKIFIGSPSIPSRPDAV
jgi:hypothetical protein